MELERHVNGLREQLAAAAEPGGEEARALAQRLTAPLDAAVRLMLLGVLEGAAAEITRELAPRSVELRLRGGDPEFVVTGSAGPDEAAGGGAGDISNAVGAWSAGGSLPAPAGTGEGGVSRINLRLPDELKSRVEQAAEREGLSVNSWLVRVAAATVERGETGLRAPEQDTARGGRRYTGWAR
jgi:HicB family